MIFWRSFPGPSRTCSRRQHSSVTSACLQRTVLPVAVPSRYLARDHYPDRYCFALGSGLQQWEVEGLGLGAHLLLAVPWSWRACYQLLEPTDH